MYAAICFARVFRIVAGSFDEFCCVPRGSLGLWVRWVGIALVALRPFGRGDPGSFGQKAASTHARSGTGVDRAHC